MIRTTNKKRADGAKLVSCAAALALTTAMAVPGTALAATQVTVDGTDYTAASSGEGWSWDGADDMTLNNYAGGAIYAIGDLVITLVGENVVASTEDNMGAIEISGQYDPNTGDVVDEGDLTITGEGSLEVKGEDSYGIYSYDGDINITDTTVDVSATGETDAWGVTAEYGDVIIDGSTVTVTTNTTAGSDSVIPTNEIGVSGVNVSVTDSDLEVTGSDKADGGHGVIASKYYAEPGEDAPTVLISNSKLAVSGFVSSAVSALSLTVDPDTGSPVTGEGAVGGAIVIDDAESQSAVTDFEDNGLIGKTLGDPADDTSVTVTPSVEDEGDGDGAGAGTGEEGDGAVEDDEDASKPAEGEPADDAAAEESSGSAKEAPVMAQTGDGTLLAAVGAGIAAALAAACAAISRRKVEIRE